MGNSNFINASINVEGKIYKIKVEEGIGFNYDNLQRNTPAWYVKNGSLFTWVDKATYNEYGFPLEGGAILSPKKTNEIKMSKAEFALFKNVADNINENKETISLSRADIEKAQELYKKGQFTKDISKNIPSGYKGYKNSQDLETDEYVTAEISTYDEKEEEIAKAKDQEYEYKTASMTFYHNITEDEYLEKYSKMSSDGTVKIVYAGSHDDGTWTEYTYRDKDGSLITESPDWTLDGEPAKNPVLLQVEHTDKDGKQVKTGIKRYIETPYDFKTTLDGLDYAYEQTKTFKTSDGKEALEVYNKDDNGDFILKKTAIKYKDGDTEVYELKDENGNLLNKRFYNAEKNEKIFEKYNDNKLSQRNISYTENDIEYHEVYNGDKELQNKTIRNNGKTTYEEYGPNNKLNKKTVEYYENDNQISELYDSNQTLVKKIITANSPYRGSQVIIEDYVKNCTTISKEDKIVKCEDFDIQEKTNFNLTDKELKYHWEYKNMQTAKIAQSIKEQINGISLNKTTISMIKAIPTDKIVDVLKEYKNLDSELWFDKASLFTDLQDEYFMKDEDLLSIAQQAFASYLAGKTPETLTSEDIEMTKFVQAGTSDNLKEYLHTIENYITK